MQGSDILEVAAIASRHAPKAQAAAQALGIPKSYGSYEQLLADPEIEAVYIPLPNHLHVPWTIKAMEAGKHVLCEKPIALTAADAALLLDARQRTGRLVAEAFMVRHHPQWHYVRSQVRAGALGDVRAVHAFFSYYLDDPANVRNQADIGGGSLYDVGCYAITAARYLFESEPLGAIGLMDEDPVMGVDRLTSAIVDFGAGRQLLFTCSSQLASFQQVDVCGTAARIKMAAPFNPDPQHPPRVSFHDADNPGGASVSLQEISAVDHYRLQAEAFTRAINGAPLEFPIEDAVSNMRVIDAIFRSVSSRRWESP